MDLQGVIDAFVLAKTAEGLSANTTAWYSNMLRPFLQHVGGASLFDIDARTVTGFLAAEQQRVSKSSVEARYRALMAFFNWCEEQDWLDSFTSPIGYGRRKSVKRPKTPIRAPRRATPEEVEQLLNSIVLSTWVDARDKALIGLMFATAMRRDEIVRLKVSDIDMHSRMLTTIGKNDKERLLPFTADVEFLLAVYMLVRPHWSGPELWLGAYAGGLTPRSPLTGSGVRQMFQRRCQEANLRYLNPHSLRHGSATFMLNRGGDISFVQKMLGHSSPVITERFYAEWMTEGIRRMYDEVWKQEV